MYKFTINFRKYKIGNCTEQEVPVKWAEGSLAMIVMACNAMFCMKKKCKRKVQLLAWCFIQILSQTICLSPNESLNHNGVCRADPGKASSSASYRSYWAYLSMSLFAQFMITYYSRPVWKLAFQNRTPPPPRPTTVRLISPCLSISWRRRALHVD